MLLASLRLWWPLVLLAPLTQAAQADIQQPETPLADAPLDESSMVIPAANQVNKAECGCVEIVLEEPEPLGASDVENDFLGWTGEASVAYTENAGNTSSTKIDVRSKAVWETPTLRNTYKLEGANETNGSERTRELYYASAKSDYKFPGTTYLFNLLEYTDDHFDGYDYTAAVNFGFGRDIRRNQRYEWSAEAGLGYRQSRNEESREREGEVVVRVGNVFIWNLDRDTSVDLDFSSEIGKEKTITKSYNRIKMQVNGQLFAFLAYEFKHTSDVPEGAQNMDKTTMFGFDYTF